jgi:hypothetical protein
MGKTVKEALICQVETTMFESNIHGPSGLVGNARTLKPTTSVSSALRGTNFSKKHTLSNPMDGIVIGYKAITDASPTSLIDRLRYSAAERPNFQMFNYVYKVWIPGLPGSTYNLFECSDWDDKEAFTKLMAQSPWVPVDISAGTNVQGAIPPGTTVKVRFASAACADPKIIEIGENVPNLVVPAMQKPPPGAIFKLGAPTGYGAGSSNAAAATGPYERGVDVLDFKGRLVPATIEGCRDNAATKFRPKRNILDEPIITSTVVPNAYGGYIKGKQSFIAKLERAYANLKAQGISLSIGDTTRSFEGQRKAYLTKGQPGQTKFDVRTNRSKVAHPCAGYHTEGQAVDIDQKHIADLLAHGPIYQALYNTGLRRINREFWHWSVGEASNHDRDKVFAAGVAGSPADTFTG